LISIFCSLPVRGPCDPFEDAVGIDVERDLDLRDPRGAGWMPVSWNLPSACCSVAISRSRPPGARGSRPTAGCPSAVDKTSPCVRDRLLRSNHLGHHAAFPSRFRASRSHVSQQQRPCTSRRARRPGSRARRRRPHPVDPSMPESLPVSSLTFSFTAGIRVLPPTITTLVYVLGRPCPWLRRGACDRRRARSAGPAVISFSSPGSPHVEVLAARWSSAVMTGRFICAPRGRELDPFAFLGRLVRRWSAIGSAERSMPWLF